MTTVWSRGNGPPDEDLWDDTELIRAYDEAVKSYKKAVSQGGADAESGEEQPVSKQAPRPPKADQPAAKRAKPAAAPQKSAPAAGALNAETPAGDASAAAQYWQPGYAQSSWYSHQAVAPSYFAPSISAPLPPVQDEALMQLLTAWYNAGYQAGRYQALRGAPS